MRVCCIYKYSYSDFGCVVNEYVKKKIWFNMEEELNDRAVPMEENSAPQPGAVIDFASMRECTATQLINDADHRERLTAADRGSLLSESDHIVMKRISDFVRDAWSMSDESLMDVMSQIKDGKIDYPGATRGRSNKPSLGSREPWYVNSTLERDDFEYVIYCVCVCALIHSHVCNII